jgi:hypothetical protein
MDPQGIGVSTNVMIPYFQSFAKFVPNDNSVGDGLNFVGYRFSGPVAINTNIGTSPAPITKSPAMATTQSSGAAGCVTTRMAVCPIFRAAALKFRRWTTAKDFPWATPQCCGRRS